MKEVTVLITGSSRPPLLKSMWESFQKMVIFRGKMRIIVHEDFVYPEESKEVEKFWKKQNVELICTQPAEGLGYALNRLLPSIKTKYMFYTQEDWYFERPIDLDMIMWLMDQNEKLNLVLFNKYSNFPNVNRLSQDQVSFDNIDMCLYRGWSLIPGVWKMPFIRGIMGNRPFPKDRPEGWLTNLFGNHEQRSDTQFCIDKVGAYLLGRTGEPRFVRHLGNDWRMAHWQRENGIPGGRYENPFDDKHAPWIDDENMVERPSGKDYFTNKGYKCK